LRNGPEPPGSPVVLTRGGMRVFDLGIGKALLRLALATALVVLGSAWAASAHAHVGGAVSSSMQLSATPDCPDQVASLPGAECCRAGDCCGFSCCPSLMLAPASTRLATWQTFHRPRASERRQAGLSLDISPPPPKRPSRPAKGRRAAADLSQPMNTRRIQCVL
jgi:hypothetical protein